MNKTKSIVTGFAIFAAFLMLMATCIAGPVSEKTNIEAVENEQQEFLDSVEAMCSRIENDQELLSLIDQISNDRTLKRIASSIENTDDLDEKNSLTDDYFNVLENKQEFSDLQSYFENSYTEDIQGIGNEFVDLLETLIESLDTDTESEDLVIAGFMPVGDVIPVGLPDGDLELIEGQQDLTISSSGDIVLMSEELDPINNNDGDSPIDLDSGEAQYGGFAFNRDGGMLVPGYGWVYPDDPNWDDWYNLHNSLQGLPMSSATAVLDIIAEMFGDGEQPTGPIIDTIIEIINEIIRIIVETVLGIIVELGDLIYEICALIILAIGWTVGLILLGFFIIYMVIWMALEDILEWLKNLNP